ncbi:MAG: TonB-dependent receptor [Ferruginibacter sp.]|uniref:TonB-dependent receptor n=1 Tax=Ferruginibacter sp. TaxID=1940288 RepID=UPI00265860CD|nr:carboxypeptidase regulatory-like domain-containing protein [Ferruginibacter sp.]MDB5280569.1 TonB-dependent receptor [Ferruginibacter sp.]
MRKLIFALLMLAGITGYAQETVSSLSGIIHDEKGAIIQGATVELTHVPTGAVTKTQTNKKGIFSITNLKPGGPYAIAITFVGFKEERAQDVNLALGSNPDLDIVMKVNTGSLEAVVVSATKKNSNGLSIGRAQMNTLPTLGRSLGDFTRLTPQSNNNSFAGSNFRYNNLTVDGAVNNDAIGFSNSFGGTSGGGQSGAAGAGTRTNPYSIDVIQEVQVQLSPFDVKLGNFTGGSVNAVTKSGTNTIHGSVYGYGRNQALMGKSVDGLKTKIGSDFHDYQYGATLSGPIVKNKAFFIVNFEQTRRQEPTFYNAGDPGAAISLADAASIYNQLKTKYNYDAGSYQGAYKIFTNSDKLFARLDFKLNPKSTLTVRGIYTNGVGNNLERTSTNFQFGSTDFTQHTKNINLTSELKTTISNQLSNQLSVSYINVHEFRDFPGVLSPFMDIGGGAAWAGTWREASIYNMKQQTIEVNDNLTLTKGIHKFTFGTHNEFYKLTCGFVNSWNGRWEYSNPANFMADKPSRIRGAYSINNKYPNTRDDLYNNPPSPYNVNLTSVYAQDEISLHRNFKITGGFRIDYPFLGNNVAVDKDFATAKNNTSNATYNNTPFNQLTNKWLGKPTISPRLGFNWNVKGDQSLVVRGGTGIFVGRMPFAWLGYAETLSGGNYNNIDFKPSATNTTGGNVSIPLAINPLNLQDTINAHALASANAGTTREIDVIDNHFKLPTVWRSNIAVDIRFGRGYKLTLDALYTKTLYDVKFQQINIKDSVQYFTSGPSQSPVYVGGKLNSQYSNVYLLTNTTKGYRYNLTAQLNKNSNYSKLGSHRISLNWSAAYTYGMSKDLSNGIRNSFQSNFEVNPAIVANNPQLAYSNFDLRHRIVATAGVNLEWNKTNLTTLAFFYAGQSGSPYSVVYNSGGNPFGNAANANLPYIPRDQNDIRLADFTKNGQVYTAAQQWTDLNSLISGDKYLNSRRGQYAERNGLRTPWNHDVDMKLMHEFKFGKEGSRSIQISLDIFNVLNLLNNNWGHVYFVTNVNNYTANLLTFVKDANGVAAGKPSSGYLPTFNFNAPTGLNNHYYTVDPLNSRFQAQFGVKYNF